MRALGQRKLTFQIFFLSVGELCGASKAQYRLTFLLKWVAAMIRCLGSREFINVARPTFFFSFCVLGPLAFFVLACGTKGQTIKTSSTLNSF